MVHLIRLRATANFHSGILCTLQQIIKKKKKKKCGSDGSGTKQTVQVFYANATEKEKKKKKENKPAGAFQAVKAATSLGAND